MPHSVSDRYLFESKNTHFFFLFKMTKKEKRQSVAHLNIYGYHHRQPFKRVTLNPFVEIASRCDLRVTRL